MTAYYNEIDPFAAEWLRALVAANLIAPGDVDERNVQDVHPDDLRGYRQCHFFAGIGVWSYALRQAGWDDDRPVWTGSCPCQPFSAAGQGGGFADERHLWPFWFHLVRERRPAVVLGEQVASKDGLGWLDLVQTDMEAAGYAFGAVDTCAAGFGAPHIRQRLYWAGERLEHSAGDGWQQWRPEPGERSAFGGCGHGGLADADGARSQGRHVGGNGAGQRPAGKGGVAGGLADADRSRQLEALYTRERGARNKQAQSSWSGASGGLAEPGGERREGQQVRLQPGRSRQAGAEAAGSGGHGGLADVGGEGDGGRRVQRPGQGDGAGTGTACQRPQGLRADGGMADAANRSGTDQRHGDGPAGQHVGDVDRAGVGNGMWHGATGDFEAAAGDAGTAGFRDRLERPGAADGFWAAADWLFCRDGKWRPVEPGASPLAARTAARVGRLRGYGNALNAVQAQAFVEAFMSPED